MPTPSVTGPAYQFTAQYKCDINSPSVRKGIWELFPTMSYDDVTMSYHDVTMSYDDVTMRYDDVTMSYDDVTMSYDDVAMIGALYVVPPARESLAPNFTPII